MRMKLTNLAEVQHSLDIPLADGTNIRELLQPGEDKFIEDINPWDVNVDLTTRELVETRLLKIAFVEDANDLLQTTSRLLDPARVATTSNITLAGLQTIDGVAVSVGDRVLVKNQTAPSENGVYRVTASTWERVPELSDPSQYTPYTMVFASEGVTNVGRAYVQDSTTSWAEFGGGGSGGTTKVQLARRVDETADGSTIYIGEAQPGTPASTAAWRIKRISFIGPESADTNIEWANGVADFVNVWDDRLTLSYS